MPKFDYRAKTAGGENIDGTISAASPREAMNMLRSQSLFPVKVSDPQEESGGAWDFGIEFPRRIKTEIVGDTLTQLGDLLGGGVNLLEALKILSQESPDIQMRQVLSDIRDRVADGRNLDEALAEHPAVFSELIVNMVRAGLEGAFLEESLQHIAAFLRKQDELRAKVVGAMTYPAILMVVGSIVTVVLVLYIVPMFEPFFERLERSGVGLPWVTVILLTVSHSLLRYGIFVAAALVGLVWLLRQAIETERGRRMFDGLKLKLPVAGDVFHTTAVSRFCRVLGTLLRNGVPILKSLDISSASTGNVLLAETIRRSAENISSGNSLAAPLMSSGLIPPQVMAMIRVAEESNTLDSVLVSIADRMDQKTERKLDALVRLIEPLMLLAIGAVVMFIITGVLLPVFDMNTALD